MTAVALDMAALVAEFDDLTATPAKPTPLPIIAANIPIAMRERRQWVVWKYTWTGSKWTKPPFIAGGVGKASSTNPATWREFDFCVAQYEAGKCDGIGYVFAEGDGLAGIDLDHCFDGQEFLPEAKDIIARFDGLAYLEKSVGGDGCHLIVRGDMVRSGKAPGNLKWIEGYDYKSPRYFTVSGHRMDGSSVDEPQEAQEALNWIHENYLKKAEKVRPEGPTAPVFDPADEAEDEFLIARIRKSSKQGDKFAQLFDEGTFVNRETGEITYDPSALDMKLVEMLAFWCSRDEEQMDRIFRRSVLYREKWDSSRGSGTYGSMTIAKGIKYNLDHGGKAFKDARQADEGPSDPSRYLPLRYGDLLTLPPAEEIVEDLLPAKGTFCIFGQSGAGKTFLAIDLMLAIAKGETEWFGRYVRQTPVLYMALEGQQGIRDRLIAYLMERGGEIPDSFRVIYEPFDITSGRDRPDLIQAIKASGLVNPVVVIDTMTRATPGMDLNGPKDMGAVINGISEIQRNIDGLVGTIYHSTIKSSGTSEDATEMGHSSYRGSLDASILVYEKDGVKCWYSKKVKDAASGDTFSFSLSVHEVRKNQWDRPKTSCAVIPMTKAEADNVRERRINAQTQAEMKKVIDHLWLEEETNSPDKKWFGVPNRTCLKFIGKQKKDAIAILAGMVDMGAIRLIQDGNAKTSPKYYRINTDWEAPEEFQPFPPPPADLSVPEEDNDDI